MLCEIRTEFPHPSDDQTASVLFHMGSFGYELDDLKDKINDMVAAGSRYRNLEKELGLGVTFALGTEISESV